jgi:signal transduction histidine kinase/DNA-binding response OmpR family regulator
MKGESIDCNQYAVDMLEYPSKGELNMATVEDCTPEFQRCGTPSVEYFENIFAKAAAQGRFEGTFTAKAITGREIFCELTAVKVEYNGEFALMASLRETAEDFNLLRQIKIERAATERMKAILDSSPMLCMIFDTDANVIDANDLCLVFSGISDKQEYIEKFYDMAPEFQADGKRSRDKAREIAQEAFEKGQAFCEWVHSTAAGEPFPSEFYAKRVHFNNQDAVIVHARDMREHYKYKEAERTAQERLQMMLDSSPLLCVIFDDNKAAIEVNNTAITMFGIDDISIYCERFFDLSPEYQPDGIKSVEKFFMVMKTAFETGRNHFEWLHQSLEGDPIPCSVNLERILMNDRYVVIAYIWDLREQKALLAELEDAYQSKSRMEIAEQSNQAKSRFLARMSHEIRTPITAVLGISEIQLQNPNLPPEMAESFAKIHTSAILLLTIINDILDLSKIEAGKMKVTHDEYEAASMISDVTHLNLSYLGGKDIEFRLSVDENLPSLLIGDVVRIEQIMNNLLSNAFKYTEQGFVWLSVFWEKSDLVITVKDTGRGMSEDQLQTLTSNEYIRFHEDENREIGGTGLGMSIVFNLVQIMDAKIEIKSTVGKGTTVTVRIPQQLAGEGVLGKETVQSLQHLESATLFTSKKLQFALEPMPYGKVLVVDDVEANLYVARGLLNFYDLKIETCDSGRAAIEKIEQGNVYDVIFMDHMMPGLNGTETLHIIRSMGYTGSIVVLTANALIGQSDQFILDGFDGFISKPIQTKHLNTILTRHIRNKQPAHVLAAAKRTSTEGRTEKDINDFQNDAALQEKLRKDFAESQKNTISGINDALQANPDQARLLAHTLKSLAGLIHETDLMQTAEKVEIEIANTKTPSPALLAALEEKLNTVLSTISQPPHSAAQSAASILFDTLTPLLESRSSKCMNLLPDLKKIPEAAIVAAQIESFDYKPAAESLKILRKVMGV